MRNLKVDIVNIKAMHKMEKRKINVERKYIKLS